MITPLLGQCRSDQCKASIVMTLTKNGKYLPVDFDQAFAAAEHQTIPGPHGRPVYSFQPAYTPHWSTCTDPEAFRRRKQKRPAPKVEPTPTKEPAPDQGGLF